jgi:putative transposase
MRQIYLQKQFYQLAKRLPPKLSEQAKHRLQIVKAWLALREQGLTGKQAAEVLEMSRATLYRWQARIEHEGLKGLEERSRRPRRVRQRQWGVKEITLIQELRELYPRWGKEKLAILARREGISLSVSTTGRILKYLKERGYIKEASLKRPTYTKKRPKRPYAIRKPKDYAVEQPGDLVQIDTLDIHPIPSIHLKHFTARDVISRWDVIETFPRASSINAKAFLSTVIKRMPFPVKAVQVDGGSEFKKHFEEACEELGLKLFILPPRSPKLNGRVERAHRTHLDEFYSAYPIDFSSPSLNLVLEEWERIYNHVRPHRALDNLTPYEYIQHYHPSLDPCLSHMY